MKPACTGNERPAKALLRAADLLGEHDAGRARASAVAAISRPRRRDLADRELAALAAEIADRPELWIDLITHDRAQRRYAELLRDEHVTAWLICWMDDHDTGFHDHDVSSGAVAVVSGRVREERLVLEGQPRDRVFDAGEVFHFSPADIHRIRHCGADPAVTLHVYSPPLLRTGAYFVDGEGVLARRPMSAAEELRPLDAARA
jgi:predicted metal-dependent enzyme (double-stranded beta helix superfamily)